MANALPSGNESTVKLSNHSRPSPTHHRRVPHSNFALVAKFVGIVTSKIQTSPTPVIPSEVDRENTRVLLSSPYSSFATSRITSMTTNNRIAHSTTSDRHSRRARRSACSVSQACAPEPILRAGISGLVPPTRIKPSREGHLDAGLADTVKDIALPPESALVATQGIQTCQYLPSGLGTA